MNVITDSLLQVVAGDIEKLLLESREHIAFAYKQIPDGIKVSFGINFDPSSDGVVVNYDMGFDLEPKPEPPEKHKVKYRHTINEGQAAMEFLGKEIREGRMSVTAGDVTVGEIKP